MNTAPWKDRPTGRYLYLICLAAEAGLNLSEYEELKAKCKSEKELERSLIKKNEKRK